MAFRTLLIGAILLGLASGFLAPLVAPILFTLQPDEEMDFGSGPTKCRSVRTIFDSMNSTPTCSGFETLNDRIREEREHQQELGQDQGEDQEPRDTEEEARKIRETQKRLYGDDSDEE